MNLLRGTAMTFIYRCTSAISQSTDSILTTNVCNVNETLATKRTGSSKINVQRAEIYGSPRLSKKQ